MIDEKLRAAVATRLSLGGTASPAAVQRSNLLEQGIPTLETGFRRKASPMLRRRFELFGRWERATHATWLDLADMESLWLEAARDPLQAEFKRQADTLREEWPNHATGLFKDERISLFAVSDLNTESIVLMWLDFEPEPEVWAYDGNGESRYGNLEDYLDAYIANDVRAARRSWRA